MPAGPTLIFVAGPQSDQRVVLHKRRILAGRHPDADLPLSEQRVSRRQMQLELTPDGWVLENLSSHGTTVNDKRYKSGKKILLDTGDVIGIGADTEMLYVSPQDDPEEALYEYRREHPVEPAGEEPPETQVEPEADAEPAPPRAKPEPEPKRPVPPAGEAEGEPGELSDEQRQRRAKIRKYAILGAVYAVGMIVLIVFLLSLRGGGDATDREAPPRLTRQQIADIVDREMELTYNPTAASEELNEALARYPGRHFKPGQLYEVVRLFKRHLAHRQREGFADPEHERMFVRVKDELVDEVYRTYSNAWKYEQDGDWDRAHLLFSRVQRMVPEPGNPIFDNVVAHMRYVKAHMVEND